MIDSGETAKQNPADERRRRALGSQTLDGPALGGMAPIAAGVLVINLFSTSARH